MDRLTLLRPSPNKKVQDSIRLITKYNPKNPNLFQILKKFEGLLLMAKRPVIKPENFQVTYSRSPNLRDIHVKA